MSDERSISEPMGWPHSASGVAFLSDSHLSIGFNFEIDQVVSPLDKLVGAERTLAKSRCDEFGNGVGDGGEFVDPRAHC